MLIDDDRRGDWRLLIEHHCPTCGAAKACQGFCRGKLDLFQDDLGEDAEVVRAAFIAVRRYPAALSLLVGEPRMPRLDRVRGPYR